jgi:hypothetical protein
MNMIINRKIIAAISTTIYSKHLTNLMSNENGKLNEKVKNGVIL